MAGDVLIAAMMKVVGLNVMAHAMVTTVVSGEGRKKRSFFVGIAIFAVLRP